MGLLSKASEITKPEISLAFSKFITSHNIKIFAVFELINNLYSITNSIGFDTNSILSSPSTKDFWNGLCDKENLSYNFSLTNTENNPMLQFFSFDMLETLTNVNIYRKNEKIYMMCNDDFNYDIINDLNKIDFSLESFDLKELNNKFHKENSLYLYEFDFDEAIDSIIISNSKGSTNYEYLKSSIFNELYNRFACFMCKCSTKKSGSYKLKTVFNVDKEILEDHLISHIIFSLRNIMGNFAETISISNLGEIKTMAEINSIFQVD